MNSRSILTLLLVLINLAAFGQTDSTKTKQKTLEVYASVADHLTHDGIDSLKATLLRAADSSFVDTAHVESKYTHLTNPQFDYLTNETATFAGLSANTTTGRVNDMALDIEVGEGEDLEIDVKSGYGLESNNTAGANHGKFYVDLVRTWKVSDLPVTYDENASDNPIVPHTYYNKVVLNKTFVNNEWQYICLPFSLNAADIETIFGKGTSLTPALSQGEGENEASLWEPKVEGSQGLVGAIPYRIRPTDVLASPIVLEHVSITADTPQTIAADGYLITGTFQKTGDTPAFSAIVTEDPDGLGEVKNDVTGNLSNGKWYDLSGQRVESSSQRSGAGGAILNPQSSMKKAILVTKGRKVIR